MLVDAGVSCITNVPMNDLQRVSRCTGAPVLASLDQEMVLCFRCPCPCVVLITHWQVAVGTCDLFRTGQLSNQTVTFFEGCNPLACSTIILFGVQSRADLYASIMLSAIEMAYTARSAGPFISITTIVQAFARCETAIEQDLLSQVCRSLRRTPIHTMKLWPLVYLSLAPGRAWSVRDPGCECFSRPNIEQQILTWLLLLASTSLPLQRSDLNCWPFARRRNVQAYTTDQMRQKPHPRPDCCRHRCRHTHERSCSNGCSLPKDGT